MTREQILSDLLKNVGDGLWVMAALIKHGRPVSKDRIRDVTNAFFKTKNPEAKEKEMPIRSRHLLDEAAARLEGAALVTISKKGMAKMYSVSRLGLELIEFRKQQMKKG